MTDKTATQILMERHELERSLGRPPADIRTEEDYCRWALAQIDKRARELAEPYIKNLVEIESRKPARPVMIPLADLPDIFSRISPMTKD